MAEAPPPSDASPTLVVELGAARFDQPARYFLTLQLTMGGEEAGDAQRTEVAALATD